MKKRKQTCKNSNLFIRTSSKKSRRLNTMLSKRKKLSKTQKSGKKKEVNLSIEISNKRFRDMIDIE